MTSPETAGHGSGVDWVVSRNHGDSTARTTDAGHGDLVRTDLTLIGGNMIESAGVALVAGSCRQTTIRRSEVTTG
jgi:hypothetical protein